MASNYSAMAEVLARSFLDHHPGSTFTVLVVDDGECELVDGVDVARLADLDIDPAAVDVMRSIYDVMEFSTSVKASFLRLLLDRGATTGSDDVVACYLDPDIVVHAPFDDRVAEARDHGLVLTPHVLTPIPRDGKHVKEGTIMQSGMFNCGFLAVGAGGRGFLDWWDVRLRFDAVVDFERSHFTDQRWVDWVPSLFDHHVCRDPGMNVAWWNVHERHVELDDRGAPRVGGEPVRFVHFSGYDPNRPEVLSRFQDDAPRVPHDVGTAMRSLADDYAERLAAAGHLERRHLPYRWATSIDGVELTAQVRRRVRSAILDEVGEDGVTSAERATPDAFGGGSVPLGRWLTTHGGGDGDGVDGVDGGDGGDGGGGAVTGGGDGAEAGASGIGRAPGLADRGRDTVRRVARAGRRAAERGAVALSSPPPRSEPGESGVRPFAFLHVPKSAGSSITAALREALPGHRWSDAVFDPVWMGPYRHAPRPVAQAHQVLERVEDLHDADAVAGHLALDTLLTRFAPGDIATVVREPRCRLLSHYEFWRGLPADARAAEQPWESSHGAMTQDFAEWLADEAIAYQTDNTLIRQLVDDPAIPELAFIPNAELNRLARLATAQLRRLGWVGVVELGDATWASLGEFVGAPLSPRRINVTERDPRRPVDLDAVFGRAAPLLASRTAGDAIVWEAAARRAGADNPAVLADASWMRRLGATVRTEAAAASAAP